MTAVQGSVTACNLWRMNLHMKRLIANDKLFCSRGTTVKHYRTNVVDLDCILICQHLIKEKKFFAPCIFLLSFSDAFKLIALFAQYVGDVYIRLRKSYCFVPFGRSDRLKRLSSLPTNISRDLLNNISCNTCPHFRITSIPFREYGLQELGSNMTI
uniref:Uncharacterized protein n=1 Tax=Glossina pallidipes TaxID=7398 RepID=A0A1A9Z8U1_GLOPL